MTGKILTDTGTHKLIERERYSVRYSWWAKETPDCYLAGFMTREAADEYGRGKGWI